MEMWSWYGSGDYKIYLNDGGFQPARKVAECFITGIRDFDTYPPVIDDYGDVVLEDKSNRSYLKWCRLKNIPIPGLQAEKEDEDVAATAVVSDLAQAALKRNDELTDRLIAQAHTPPQTSSPSIIHTAPSVEVMKDAAQAAQELVAHGAKSALDTMAVHARQQQDPIQGLERLMGLVQKIYPGNNGQDSIMYQAMRGQIDALQTQVERMNADRTAALMERIAGLEAKLTTQVAPQQALVPATAPKTALDMLKEFKGLRQTINDLMGDDDDDKPKNRTATPVPAEGAGDPWYIRLAPILIPAGMFAISALTNMMYNQAVVSSGGKSGAPQPPPNPPPVDPNTMPAEVRQAMQAQTLQQGAQGQPGVAQQQQGRQEQVKHPVQLLVEAIQGPLVKHIEEDRDGHEFADWFINGHGKIMYGQLRQLGKDQIVQAISHYSPAAGMALVGMGAAAADKFLDEFLEGPEEPTPN